MRTNATEFVGDSPAATFLRTAIERVATSDAKVLISGESGSGKEVVARTIHARSPRAVRPFVAVNCAGIPENLLESELFGHLKGSFTGAHRDKPGKLEMADGGTVFLDEISDVSPAFQVSLLRFLQEGEVKPLGTHQTRHCNVRIIAASNQNLKELVDQKKFRRDLYYRLRGFELNIPPLRERPDDIPVLAEHAAQKYAESLHKKVPGISADALQRLKVHPFPGNVRELENEVRRMVALAGDGEFLSAKLMSPEFARLVPREARAAGPSFAEARGSVKDKVEALEMHLVAQSLLAHRWNHSRAARDLGLSRVGLANKIKRYKLDRKPAEQETP